MWDHLVRAVREPSPPDPGQQADVQDLPDGDDQHGPGLLHGDVQILCRSVTSIRVSKKV